MTRDRHVTAVYEAEDFVARTLRRGGVVDFHGSLLDLPRERHFGDLPAVRRYLDSVRQLPWGYAGTTPDPQVVSTRATTRAAWRAPSTIAIPDGPRWALRELVVLHEYAHHVAFHTAKSTIHDRDFCLVLIELVRHAMSPEVATLLMAAYSESGVLAQRGIQVGHTDVY